MATLIQHQVPDEQTPQLTSIAVSSNGTICASWKGDGNQAISINFCTDTGVPNWQWFGYRSLNNEASDFAPAVAFLGERLFIAWVAADGTNRICYTFTYDLGKTFAQTVVLDRTNAIASPGLTAGTSLFISYTDQNKNGQVMKVG